MGDTYKSLVKEITGCRLVYTNTEMEHVCQEPGFIEVDRGPGLKERIIHEVLHWLVASEKQRTMHNLGLSTWLDEDKRLSLEAIEYQERIVCRLEFLVYSARGRQLPKNPSCGTRMKRKFMFRDLIEAMNRIGEEDFEKVVRLAGCRS